MSDIKQIIATNLIELRKRKKYTQQDLGAMLQYSDKAISKWEKGESLPDIEVLYEICNIYGVTLDYLTHEGNYEDKKEFLKTESKSNLRNKIIIVALAVTLIWMIFLYIYIYLITWPKHNYWPIIVWALPPSFIVMLIFNSIWGIRKWRFPILSFLNWTSIAAVYLSFVPFEQNTWPVFLLGIPIQVAIVLWGLMKKE